QADHLVDLTVARGHHDHRHRGLLAQLLAHLGPAHPGQHQVEQHDVGSDGLEMVERGRSVLADVDLEPFLAQQERERLGQRGLVLHDQHTGHRGSSFLSGAPAVAARGAPSAGWVLAVTAWSPDRWTGISRVKVEPSPWRDHRRIRPLWLMATCLTIARPSPVPPVARERALSTR